jgi:multicomponent Na+:H+ antiporter subunit G
MTITELAVLILTAIGVFFMLVSTYGILRLPDVYTRMHAAGKAATLGISCLMIAAGIYYPHYLGRMIVLVLFFFITAPIATTTMARATYRTAKPAEKLLLQHDDLRGNSG